MKLPKRAQQGDARPPAAPGQAGWNAAWEAQPYLDPEQQRLAQLMAILLRILLGASALIYLIMLASPLNAWVIFGIASALMLVNLSSLYLLRTGRLRPSILLLIGGLTLVLSVAGMLSASVINTPFVGLIIIVMIAGMLLGGLGGLVMAGIASFIGLALVMAQLNNSLPPAVLGATPLGFWVSLSVGFFAAAGLIYLADSSLRAALFQARQNEAAQAQAVTDLEKIRASLEDQVAQRTRELEQRSGYLQTILDVSQSTAALLDRGQVMNTVVRLIKEQFDLYYVGLFLVDAGREWAVLYAGEGPGRAVQTMLGRGHRLRIGSGMIGWSIANAQPRLAGEAQQDLVRLAASELPETRSEAAIPLRSRGRVIGAISVQSQRPNAFGEMEIAAFQALADQVAITLDNARLYSESAQALEEARRAYGQTSRLAWQDFLQSRQEIDLTYRYGRITNAGEAPADDPASQAAQQAARQQALTSGQPVQISAGPHALLYLPIPVREITVGVIGFAKEIKAEAGGLQAGGGGPAAWVEDEIELLQTIVEQMGLALDSARLYQDTQRLAQREQVTGEVTAHIRQTLDIQTVLRTAVEEIQRVFSLPEVVISLSGSDDDPGAPPAEAQDEWVLAEPDLPPAVKSPTIAGPGHNGGHPQGSR